MRTRSIRTRFVIVAIMTVVTLLLSGTAQTMMAVASITAFVVWAFLRPLPRKPMSGFKIHNPSKDQR